MHAVPYGHLRGSKIRIFDLQVEGGSDPAGLNITIILPSYNNLSSTYSFPSSSSSQPCERPLPPPAHQASSQSNTSTHTPLHPPVLATHPLATSSQQQVQTASSISGTPPPPSLPHPPRRTGISSPFVGYIQAGSTIFRSLRMVFTSLPHQTMGQPLFGPYSPAHRSGSWQDIQATSYAWRSTRKGTY